MPHFRLFLTSCATFISFLMPLPASTREGVTDTAFEPIRFSPLNHQASPEVDFTRIEGGKVAPVTQFGVLK
jgi:hypothetical protein